MEGCCRGRLRRTDWRPAVLVLDIGFSVIHACLGFRVSGFGLPPVRVGGHGALTGGGGPGMVWVAL